jgi:glutathione synthase/RimK-type ligase-like ATP-grasp enzyme
MEPSVLLVATATRWLGTARMPRELARSGWSVSLLAPRGSLAEHSRFVRRIGYLPDGATPLQWVRAFAAMVQASSPRLVMPCDDTAFRLMHRLAVAPPDTMEMGLRARLAELIGKSLGDSARFGASVDKTRLCPVAEAAGVRVPPYALVSRPADAESFAAAHGWPVVLKRAHSSAGDGVAICADRNASGREFARLTSRGPAPDLNDSDITRLLVQAFIPGHTRYYAGTAWRGELLCGYAVDKLAGEPKGPASVVRYFHCAALEASAARLAAAFGASGIFAPEYIVHQRTGEPYLMEINRRITPGTHRGAFMGLGSGAALLAACEDTPSDRRMRLADGEECVFVGFPHEWLRDPDSEYLRDHPVDVPWDEPELMEAMIAGRHQR